MDLSPLRQSCERLRALDPDYPRMYSVAPMADQGKRRWWPLAQALRRERPGTEREGTNRVARMFERARADLGTDHIASAQVATALVHASIGRVATLFVLDGRAWDPCADNLWIHMDNDEGVDWAGIVDETLRVVPTDPHAGAPGTVVLPSEAALAMWTAHRAMSSLRVIHLAVGRAHPMRAERYWPLVGQAVLGAASAGPTLGGVDELVAHRRGQLLLDALTQLGAPVRFRRLGCPTALGMRGRARGAGSANSVGTLAG